MSLECARRVLAIEAGAIQGLIPRLGNGFLQAVEILQGCRGRVVLTGMGKSGFIAKKIAATLASTGTWGWSSAATWCWPSPTAGRPKS